jgi:hypothetical protein
MVMAVMVSIWLTSRRIVAEKVRVLSLFRTLPGYECGFAAFAVCVASLPLVGRVDASEASIGVGVKK